MVGTAGAGLATRTAVRAASATLWPGGRGAHRFEHVETAPDELLPRFVELDVSASPTAVRRPHPRRRHRRVVAPGLRPGRPGLTATGPGRAGATHILGSNRPVAHYDARAVPATARRPKGAAARRPGLTASQALERCTGHAGGAAGAAGITGRIASGHRADLAALPVDPVHAPCDELTDAPVTLTVTDGHVVHRAARRRPGQRRISTPSAPPGTLIPVNGTGNRKPGAGRGARSG
ncbi:amidohydrolase family protein [Streptomyces griseochromogenes]|uniref:amidohydrolase family protein n=1 Tax=Streptomyces griseochromogenes TaxID=68214 RepID=UPI000A913C4E